MSIFARLVDAQVLYENARWHGALLSLLVAVAGTSKNATPRRADGEAFKRFLRDETHNLTSSVCNTGFANFELEFREQMRRLEDVLYKFVRCELAHEGTMPEDARCCAAGPPSG